MVFSAIKFRIFIVLAVLLVFAVIFYVGIHRNKTNIVSPLMGKMIPAFSLTVLGQKDQQIRDTDLRGQVTLVNVWASWCPTCFAEHPVLIKMAKAGQLRMIGVNYKDNQLDAQNFLSKYGDPFELSIFDPQGFFGLDLGVYATPESFLLDKQGVIRYKHIGNITEELWKDELEPLIMKLKQEHV